MRIEPHTYAHVNRNAYGRRIGKPPYIVIHYSASDSDTTADEINAWHLGNGWNGIGYHAVVLPNGRIIRGRPVWAMGAHCVGHNECLGICFISSTGKLTAKQLLSGAWLVLRWRKYGNVPRSRVKRHRDMSGNSTDCPGILPMAKIGG